MLLLLIGCWISLMAVVTGVLPATLNTSSSATLLPTVSTPLTAGARSLMCA